METVTQDPHPIAGAAKPAEPPRLRKYLCKLLANPYNVYTGTLAGVTLARFELEIEFRERKDPKTGIVSRKPTGQKWYREAVFELTEETVERFQARLPFAVLRRHSGVVKLDANWDKNDKKFTRPAAEGDLPLADYIDFRPWAGPTSDELASLQVENERLKAQLEALKAQNEQDETDDRAKESETIAGTDREVGPRNRKRRGTGNS